MGAEIFASPELRAAWQQRQSGGPVCIPPTITLGGAQGANTMLAHGYPEAAAMEVNNMGDAVTYYQTPDGLVHVKANDIEGIELSPEVTVSGWDGLQTWLKERGYKLPEPVSGPVIDLN